MTPQSPPNFWQLALYPIFAAIGGLLGYLMRSFDAGARVSVARALLEMFSAAFAGVLVMLLCQSMHWSMQWTGIATGICGWIGATASIRYLEKILVKRTGGGSNVPPNA